MSEQIDVVYALPQRQVVISVNCALPASIEQVIRQSGVLEQFPEIVLEDEMVGIYGFRHPLNHLVKPGDRVEIYRPLTMSPTEARKLRALSRKKSQNSP